MLSTTQKRFRVMVYGALGTACVLALILALAAPDELDVSEAQVAAVYLTILIGSNKTFNAKPIYGRRKLGAIATFIGTGFLHRDRLPARGHRLRRIGKNRTRPERASANSVRIRRSNDCYRRSDLYFLWLRTQRMANLRRIAAPTPGPDHPWLGPKTEPEIPVSAPSDHANPYPENGKE